MNDLRWRRFLISNPSDWPVTFKGLLLVKETPLFVNLSTGNERSVSIVGKYVDKCPLLVESY